MQAYQQSFIETALTHQVLRFGEFTLKSGRISPYFFNAGLFNSGAALAEVGCCYAQAIIASQLSFDMIFGPAYKGIPLASSTAMALATLTNQATPYAFDRKEAKQHGEGGNIVGAPLQGRVLIIDDVMTAGTAVRHSIELIEQQGAEVAAVVVAFDRQERGQGELSAVEELAKRLAKPVVSIVNFADVLSFIATNTQWSEHLAALEAYRQEYGVSL